MDPQEITQELEQPGARSLLDSATLLRLAWARKLDIVDGVPDEYLAASRKALGADQVPELERQVRSMYDQMARISIEPVWARFFDFGAGRMPSFLTKLAGGA
jgi:hypothetical protein